MAAVMDDLMSEIETGPKAQNRLLYVVCAVVLVMLSYVLIMYFLNSRQTQKSHPQSSLMAGSGAVKGFQIPTASSTVELSNLAKGAGQRVPILMYHQIRQAAPNESRMEKLMSVSPDLFKQELQYLKDQGYAGVSLADFVAYAKNKKVLPKKPVIITFDDGWETQYQAAFPWLKEFGFTATFFLVTDDLGHAKIMTWEQAKELANSNMIIGSHTKTHPYLNRLPDVSRQEDEIVNSKKILEEHLGVPVTVFAYPYGAYNSSLETMVKKAGYIAARSAQKGLARLTDDLYTLRTITVTGDFARFKYKLATGN